MSRALFLLQDVNTNITGQTQFSNGHQKNIVLSAAGAFGTVTVEISIDGTIWLPITDPTGTPINTFTVPSLVSSLSIANGLQVRASLSGATGTPVTVVMYN